MKVYRLIFLVLLVVAVGIASALFSRSEPPILSESTDRIPSMTVYYPADMTLLPDVPFASEAGFDAVALRNFTREVPLSFPLITYLRDSEVYIQISEYDPERFRTGIMSYPEDAHFYGEDEVLSGELLEEKTVTVGDLPALERRVRYRGAKGAVDIVFTYFWSKDKPFQAILLSGSSKGEKVYEEMLRRIELKR